MQDLHEGIPENNYWIQVERFLQKETTEFFEKWVTNKEQQGTSEVVNGKEEGKTGEGNNNTEPMHVRLHNMTGGRPLAVVLLCGLLKTKEYPIEWDKVFDHLKSKQSSRLENILTMCFDDLPHEIKSCFLYFAVLPMNTAIEANKLVCMWMAEGFLRPKDGKTMERLGKIYLKDLVARNLVKVVKRESFSGGPFVAVHHKVHSFLLLEAQEANFVEIHNGDDSPPLTNTRRLSLQNYTDKYAALANPLPKLRSILSTFQEDKGHEADNKEKRKGDGGKTKTVTSEVVQNEKDETAKTLEVVQNKKDKTASTSEVVQNEKDKTDETSEVVQNKKDKTASTWEVVKNEKDKNAKAKEGVVCHRILGSGMFQRLGQNVMTNRYKHIRQMLKESRFLRVINLQRIEIGEKLPSAISNAAQLQYLGVTACSLRSIPTAIGELKHLQTLDVRDTNVDKLPPSFWKIKTLRHVFGNYLILPKRVGNLKYLQTLESIKPDEKDGWDENTFKEMVNLQSLYLSDSSGNDGNLETVSSVISNPELLEYLEKLVLKVSKSNIRMNVFTSRSQRRLRAMALCGMLVVDQVPIPDFCVPNLTFLSLKGTDVSKAFIVAVGDLALLTDLILEEGTYKDEQLAFDDGKKFKSLKRLTLSCLEKLVTLVIGEKALVKLTHLVIKSYKKGFNVDVVDTGREYVKRLEVEDKELYDRIILGSAAKKLSDQLPASSST
ncbi:hypothetical protein HU200_048838 [Digitaria exilis]|uniref:Uncharacterized protein n=1 Tax=Digitaria exilis TaxID=1010633 RepID=A0A835E906_9POAL|nr:hypothetical protein HU200_048838 [Digitaria exilis]